MANQTSERGAPKSTPPTKDSKNYFANRSNEKLKT